MTISTTTIGVTMALGYAVMLYIGVRLGQKIRSKELDSKIIQAQKLLEKIRKKNNDLVSHISTIYSLTKHDPGKFTEIDEMLSSMWME